MVNNILQYIVINRKHNILSYITIYYNKYKKRNQNCLYYITKSYNNYEMKNNIYINKYIRS